MQADKEALYIIDTNTILKYPELLGEYRCVITSHVLREVEKLEMTKSHDKKLMESIRVAKRAIDSVNDQNSVFIDMKDYKWEINSDFSTSYEDNNILQACIENDYGLITEDRLLRFKAKMYNIQVIYPENVAKSNGYTGYKVVKIEDEQLANFYENPQINQFDLLINEYVIIRNSNNKTLDIKRWNGEEHVKLQSPPKKFLTHKNDLQACAIDALMNKDIKIKFILGQYGSGKTMLTVKMGEYHVLEKGNHSKIMMIRNPIGTGEPIGYLGGDFNEKTERFFKPIVQHLDGGEDTANYLSSRGSLLAEIPYYMKGIDVQDTYMIFDEAEDADLNIIKTVGTRVGENSAIVFNGDYNQSEGKFVVDNGLKKAVESLKGNPLVSIVVLDSDVRSESSRLFAEL